MIMQTVKLKTSLSDEEMLVVAHERAPQFRAIPGLLQKYYVQREGPGKRAGNFLKT